MMNTKKNKSKSRGKPAKVIKEPENVTETPNNVEGIVQSDINIEDTRVPEIINESIRIVENDQSLSDVPKKPKRTKGKKVKETLTEEDKSKDLVDEILKEDARILEDPAIITEEILQIAPTARKKKKKSKKHDDHPQENIVCDDILSEKSTEQDNDTEKISKKEKAECLHTNLSNLSENIDTLHKSDVSSKKKKKKKNRHDSSNSETQDPCTRAFQKLVQSTKDQNKPDDDYDNVISADIVNEIVLSNISSTDKNQIQEEKTNPENIIISKKKNKKGKKHPPEQQINLEKEFTVEQKTQPSTEDLPICLGESALVSKEASPKPKAKIAKPVQKKRKTKTEYEVSKNLISSPVDLEISSSEQFDNENKTEGENENIHPIETKTLAANEVIVENITSMSEKMGEDDIILEHLSSSQNTVSVTEITECLSTVADLIEKPNENREMSSGSSNDLLDFVEVKTNKNKKKRNKNILFAPDTFETITPSTTKPSTEVEKLEVEQESDISCTKTKDETINDVNPINMEESSIIPELLNKQNISIPDLIEYPRSTSQLQVDANNNTTVIREIITPEEIKLDIPKCTSSPIIQGSGESPEAKIKNDDPITITETISELDRSNDKNIIHSEKKDKEVSEKTDIKSKIIEVNKDMEDLRLSIERSLAELNAVEQHDIEVDREFEELFQSQLLKPESNEDKNLSNDCTDIKNTEKSKNNTEEMQTDVPIKTKIEDKEVIKYELDTEVDEGLLSLQTPKVTVSGQTSKSNISIVETQDETTTAIIYEVAPACPTRRGKNKKKEKGKKNVINTTSTTTTNTSINEAQAESGKRDGTQKSQKSEEKSESTQEKGKQQASGDAKDSVTSLSLDVSFEPIDNFEDALTSSVDDINKTFEIIVQDATQSINSLQHQNNPEINVISPTDDIKQEEDPDENKGKTRKQSPISRPKNLLGQPKISASLNKTDYKKEKSKPPNSIQAKVKIKDSVEIEKDTNLSKSQLNYKLKYDFNYFMNTKDDIIYKYSFRKVFLQNICHVCKKDLVHRVPCKFCSLVFYCSPKHKDEDWPQHQSLCFAVSTITHLKEQKHIYGDAQNIVGHNYRVLRMQIILSCEKILNRKLVPWEQEMLLYPRICADIKCRQWKQGQLKDCERCGQISYCIEHPEHLPSTHQRWCKSYALYQKLVNYQQTKGRLEPRLPTKVLNHFQIPGNINDVLGSMYEEKIDMDDMQYATLTQIATGPLTAAYCYQIYTSKLNSTCANGVRKKSTFTIHIVGAEIPLEIDVLNKWEIFFLHLRSDIQDLRVVMVAPNIKSSKLPLDLLGKIKLCENCETNKRRVLFEFHDNNSYHDYYVSDGFVTPDIVCAFNSNIHKSSVYNSETWQPAINSILKQRVPFVLTSYTAEELRRDLGKVRECARVDFNVISEIKYNPFGNVRPDRNFITDHEIPLLFKSYSYCILCGTL